MGGLCEGLLPSDTKGAKCIFLYLGTLARKEGNQSSDSCSAGESGREMEREIEEEAERERERMRRDRKREWEDERETEHHPACTDSQSQEGKESMFFL